MMCGFFTWFTAKLKVRYALGDEQPFAQRVVQHRNFVMPVRLEPGVQELYLRLASAGTIEARCGCGNPRPSMLRPSTKT